MIDDFEQQKQARIKELKALDEEIEGKKHPRILYDNSSGELPMLQIAITDEAPGGETIRSIGLVAKGHKMKDCQKGMDYLLSKQKGLGKRKPGSKYKDSSWG